MRWMGCDEFFPQPTEYKDLSKQSLHFGATNLFVIAFSSSSSYVPSLEPCSFVSCAAVPSRKRRRRFLPCVVAVDDFFETTCKSTNNCKKEDGMFIHICVAGKNVPRGCANTVPQFVTGDEVPAYPWGVEDGFSKQ